MLGCTPALSCPAAGFFGKPGSVFANQHRYRLIQTNTHGLNKPCPSEPSDHQAGSAPSSFSTCPAAPV
jgi:hypothetical protein